MDYSKTIIYKICCKDINILDCYIGHTTNFTKRKNQHKSVCNNITDDNYNRYVYTVIRDNGGWDNWNMIQLEEFSCNNKREAEAKEREWIENLKPTLNKNMPYSLYAENPEKYKQEWYEEKKEVILEKRKQHYEENKDEILLKVKQYAEENKDKIKDYQDEYREKNKEKLAEQKKIYREANKEKAAEYSKEWREANKEKLKQQKSQVIECGCGKNYTFGNKLRHLLTKQHIDYNNQLCGIIIEEEQIKEVISEEEKKQLLRQKQKEYREKNAEKIKAYKKEYNKKNAEKISKQVKEYKEKNKEHIMEQQKEYVENNKELIKEKKANWYQENKEKILNKRKELYTCECGAIVQIGGKAEHLNSSKHIEQLELKNLNN